MRLRSIGDMVLTTPALAALHAWRPDIRVSVIAEPGCAAVLEGNPAVSQILIARDFLATVRDMRRRPFAIAFNQHGGPKSAFLSAASGAPSRVCWEKRQFSFLYNVHVPEPASVDGRGMMHTVEHRMSQFYWTGLPAGPIPPAAVYPNPRVVAAMKQKLAQHGIEEKQPYAVLRPGAAYFTKRWAVGHFAEIARWLREEYGIAPVVNLGPGDEVISRMVQERFARVAVIIDQLQLRELIALLAGARLVVANDTGPTHIAAALGRPCVVIFGSSNSVWWRPWATQHRVVQNDFPCNPCRGDRCYAFDEPKCILSVTPEQVHDACASLLSECGVDRQANQNLTRIEAGN